MSRSTRAVRWDENSRAIKLILALLIAAIAAFVIHALYDDRLRAGQMAFGLYYLWWKEFAIGLDPWRVYPPCNYPPAFILTFWPLALFSRDTAYWVWQLLQIASFFAAVWLMIRETGRKSIAEITLAVAFVLILLPYFLSSTIYEAEPTSLLLLLLTCAWSLSRRGHAGWGGLMLAIATVLKVYPVVVGGFFLFRRRYTTVISGAGWTILLVLVTHPRRWMDSLQNGAGWYFKSPGWAADGRAVSILFNVYSVLMKVTKTERVPVVALLGISAAIGIVAIAAVAFVTWRGDGATELEGITLGAWCSLMLLLSPLTWNHEITLMMPVYIFALLYLMRVQQELIRTCSAGILLVLLALSLHVIAYYSTAMRNRHFDFLGVIVALVGACVIVATSEKRSYHEENERIAGSLEAPTSLEGIRSAADA